VICGSARALEEQTVTPASYPPRHRPSSVDAELTIAAVRAKGWECVRLGRRSKRPVGAHWQTTCDADEVARWLAAGDNVGLVCHERSGVAVFDVDDMLGWATMLDVLGQPTLPWVLTGSGKLHYYVAWAPELPATLWWEWRAPGRDSARTQAAASRAAASTHPDTNKPYRWITRAALGEACEPIDPVHDPLPMLPALWRDYLRGAEPAASTVPSAPPPAPAWDGDLTDLKVADWVVRLIKTGQASRHRSEAVWCVLQALVTAGHPDATITAVMLDARHGISEKPRDRGGARWLAEDLTRARAKCRVWVV